jgi:hypothetical protein
LTHPHKINEAYGPVEDDGSRMIHGMVEIAPPRWGWASPDFVREYAAGLMLAADEAETHDRPAEVYDANWPDPR